jgi:hypothetical protein
LLALPVIGLDTYVVQFGPETEYLDLVRSLAKTGKILPDKGYTPIQLTFDKHIFQIYSIEK